MREPSDVLREWYTGELGGEAIFWELAQRAEPDEARKWLALAELESRIAVRLAAVLAARQIPVPDIDSGRPSALELADASIRRPWTESMRWLERLADEALGEIQADAAGLPEELAAIGSLVVRHEAALVAFARLELAGRGDDSLRPVRECLEAARAT
jgi:hypothetical protein